MIPDLTAKERRKLLDHRLNQDHLMPFFIKWLCVKHADRPSHITDMLRRFAAMTTKEQATFHINPVTDEIIIIDYSDSYESYTKTQHNGWQSNKNTVSR